MIPKNYIIDWGNNVPWHNEAQIEQDLIISRIIVVLFSNKIIRELLLFRGGTALYKLFSLPPVRYSEDIDLVQKNAMPIGEVMATIKKIINPILGKPTYKQTKGRIVFYYKFLSEIEPVIKMKLKIEINTREHFQVFRINEIPYNIDSRWFMGTANVATYSIEELIATKLRALYQRKKGRDLFDIWYALKKLHPDTDKIIYAFKDYIKHQKIYISSREFIININKKILQPIFVNDTKLIIDPLVKYSVEDAYEYVKKELIEKI